jgi:hypothetical protein
MLRGWNALIMAISLVIAIGVGGPSTASSFTVQELVDGTSFDSPDGNLHFDNFTFTVTTEASLSTNLSDYQVIVDESLTSGGFRIVGPIGISGDNAGDIVFTYDVTANLGQQINSVGLYFNGRAFGPGALANVSEDIFAPGETEPLGRLTVFSIGGDSGEEDYQVVDYLEFDAVYSSLHIEKDISVINRGGLFAAISVIDQHFTVVPEPTTASLMFLGLMGAGAWRTSRRRSRRSGGGAEPI